MSRCTGSIVLLLSAFAFFGPVPLFSQNQAPVSDPKALALSSQSLALLTGGVAVTDVTLTANVTWIAGSDIETGTATLTAKGTTESRVDLVLSGGNSSEIRNGTVGPFPIGKWIGPDGVSHTSAIHNCWTDASWFFPALLSLFASDASVVLNYVGAETRGGVSVQRLRSYRYPTNIDPTIAASFQTVSTVDFYLDSSSLLPVSVTFNAHPDDDPGTNISIEIDFSEYKAINGVQVPLRVQKYLQGGLVLDLTITGATLNSGIPNANFNIQ